jgi:ERCC4-related helicase
MVLATLPKQQPRQACTIFLTRPSHSNRSRDVFNSLDFNSLFVQLQVSTQVLQHLIKLDPKLKPWNLKTGIIFSTNGVTSGSITMTACEQAVVLKQFGNGDINLLLATAVAEEGMDIPAANTVIRYALVLGSVCMSTDFSVR